MQTSDFRRQIPQTLRLAAPLAFSQLGQMLMGIVDTFMVGKLGPQFIGAVGLGNSIFWLCGLPCIGLLMGLDYLVSYSYGKKNLGQCNFWLVQGTYFALLVSTPMAAGIYFLSHYLNRLGLDSELAFHAQSFLSSYCWSLIPFSLFITLRQYIQSLNKVKVVTIIMFVANAANALFNWIFIYGHGVDPMGVAGSGVATFITRVLMSLALIAYILYVDRKEKLGLETTSLRVSKAGFLEITRLGYPAAAQMALEVGVFSLSTTLAGRVGVIPLAAHTIVLTVASFTFMVPLGISASAAILVGQAKGRGDPQEARLEGWVALILGIGFMLCSALALFIFGTGIMNLFTQDEAVIAVGKKVLILASLFQVFDGVQVVATGALRGLGETKIPMFANLVGHWIVGLPIGIFLCFGLSGGILGLWTGLTVGLIVVASTVLLFWARKTSLLSFDT